VEVEEDGLDRGAQGTTTTGVPTGDRSQTKAASATLWIGRPRRVVGIEWKPTARRLDWYQRTMCFMYVTSRRIGVRG